MSPTGRHILVTGSHRSGTTWLARMLALARGTVPLVFEPFNADPTQFRLGGLTDRWFAYAGDLDQEALRRLFRRILAGNERKLMLRRQWHWWNPLPTRGRVIVKDPIASMSSEWLSENFDMAVVVLVRHPAGFASSLKRLDWRFDWDNFLGQPHLMTDHLEPFRAEIEARPRDIAAQAAVLWRCIYSVLLTYAGRNPSWVVRTHESLSDDPVARIGELYGLLDLNWTPRVSASIQAHTRKGNPVAAPEGVIHALVRDSAAAVRNWKKILTPEEVDHLRDSTYEMASRFYSDEDW